MRAVRFHAYARAMTNAALQVMLAAVVVGGCGGGEERTGEMVEAREGSGRKAMKGVSAREETADTPESSEPAVGSGRVVAGYYMDDGAPDPLECTSSDDCTHGGVLDASGCCWSFRDMNAAPMTTAYRQWSQQQREQCAGAACPPPPVPTRPPDCLFTVTCVDGRCANGC